MTAPARKLTVRLRPEVAAALEDLAGRVAHLSPAPVSQVEVLEAAILGAARRGPRDAMEQVQALRSEVGPRRRVGRPSQAGRG